jgi:hypothetical protein
VGLSLGECVPFGRGLILFVVMWWKGIRVDMFERWLGMELRVHKMGLNLKGMVKMGNRCVAMDVKVHIVSLGIGGFASPCVGEAC